jgi:hypothetical protein
VEKQLQTCRKVIAAGSYFAMAALHNCWFASSGTPVGPHSIAAVAACAVANALTSSVTFHDNMTILKEPEHLQVV